MKPADAAPPKKLDDVVGSPYPVLMNTHPQPSPTLVADRRRLKTETSASNGWAARLQALQNQRDAQRPQRPEPRPR